MPCGRRPLGPANGGVTEDWGKVILRIKEDLLDRLYIQRQAIHSRVCPAPHVSRTKGRSCDHVPSVAEWSKALESDATAGGESPVRAPVLAATLCPYA